MKKVNTVMIYLALVVFMITCFGCAGKRKALRDADALAAERDAALSFEDIGLDDAPDMEMFSEPAGDLKNVFKDIYFQYNSAVIENEQSSILENVVSWMRRHPFAVVLIEGHCDERGSNEYNLALGEQRALGVRRYLVALGIESDRIHTISYGEESPAALDHNEGAWRLNRRGHFLIAE